MNDRVASKSEITSTESSGAVTPEALRAEVWVYVGAELFAKFSIEHGEYLIGRDPNCPISIDADQVSRHHARLTFNSFELIIEDLSSSNGIFIDGVQVQLPTRLRLDQEIQIGSARLFVRLHEEAARQFAAALWDQDLGLGPVREQLEGQKYKVITTLNRGGMGVILQARDLRIRRTVAMKVMKTSNQFSRENVLRFIDEAQLTGQLEHPNIVPVYELGIDEQGETFYTMKFVRGITLDAVLRGLRHGQERLVEKYPLGTLLTIFQKVCDAVAYAHSKSIVHRDLKPENIMIGSFGEVLVMDWGLAKNLTAGRTDASAVKTQSSVNASAEPQRHFRGFETLNGLIVGTPPYISPEQARGELDQVDARSDIWVLGAILYGILTLRPPVEGDDLQEVVEKIVQSRITPPSSFNASVKSDRGRSPTTPASPDTVVLAHCPGKRIPDGLSAVTMKALAVDPADRYAKVEDLQADITAFQGGFAPKAERASLLKHGLLWAGRHKAEVGLFIVFNLVILVTLVAFFLQLTTEKNRALESEKLADERLSELRGTAPTFRDEAYRLMDELRFPEALDKIDYAIEQVPNEAGYYLVRGDILQGLLRLDEAAEAYTEALRLDSRLGPAQMNLDLTRKVIAQIGTDGQIPQKALTEFYAALMGQGRRSAAQMIDSQPGVDKQRVVRIWRAALDRRGMQRFVTNADNTINVDLSRVPQPELRKLRDLPVTGVNLDDTRLPDISALKGLRLETLSIGHTPIRDLTPLIDMPLTNLNAENTPVSDLTPLHDLPLEILRLANTPVSDLKPLQGVPIEQLNLSGCRGLTDLTPLRGLPLQMVNLSQTAITDLRPLTQSPIRELNLEGCKGLTDVRALREIATLESVLLPAQCTDIEFLRKQHGLKRISYKKMTQSAEDFWKEFDARPKSASAAAP